MFYQIIRALFVFVGLVATFAATRLGNTSGNVLFAVSVGLALVFVTYAANATKKQDPSFNLLRAAEFLVNLGILFMMLGFMLAISQAVGAGNGGAAKAKLGIFAQFKPVFYAFAEAMCAAGLASLLATWLREKNDHYHKDDEATAPVATVVVEAEAVASALRSAISPELIEGLSTSLVALSTTIDEATRKAGELGPKFEEMNKALKSTAVLTDGIGKALESFDRFFGVKSYSRAAPSSLSEDGPTTVGGSRTETWFSEGEEGGGR